jgi:ABC-type lipoprotein release transport system permease subunit
VTPLAALALRSLLRAPRRTLLGLAAGAGALCAAVVIANLARGIFDQALRDAVLSGPGHLTVHRRGYLPRRDLALAFPAGDLPARLAAAPGVEAVLPRLFLPALALSGRGARAAALAGVDPAAEAAVSPLARRLAAGSFLAARGGPADGAVLSAGLAAALGLGAGDRFRVAVAAADGARREQELRVTGLLDAGLDAVEDARVIVPLPLARRLAGTTDDVHELAVVLLPGRRADSGPVRGAVGSVVAGRPGLALSSWEETLPALRDALALDRASHRLLLAAVYAIAAIGVGTTLTVSALERTREHGLLLALGAPPALLRRLVLAEAALLGAASTLAGLAAGLAITAALARWGLDARPAFREEIAYGGALFSLRLHAGWDWAETGRAAAALLLAHLAAAAWPARRAARVRPAEAMRFR